MMIATQGEKHAMKVISIKALVHGYPARPVGCLVPADESISLHAE